MNYNHSGYRQFAGIGLETEDFGEDTAAPFHPGAA
jgi:hypothetical protein